MLALDAGPNAGPWWLELADPKAPKVIARLPFVERPDHPAGMPVMVISKPLADGAARDVVLESVRVERWRDAFVQAIADIGGEVLGTAAHGAGLTLLVARPGSARPARGDKRAAVGGRGGCPQRRGRRACAKVRRPACRRRRGVTNRPDEVQASS